MRDSILKVKTNFKSKIYYQIDNWLHLLFLSTKPVTKVFVLYQYKQCVNFFSQFSASKTVVSLITN